MEKILDRLRNKKQGATMADAWIEADVDDLSSWEFINPSDDEENEDYSFDDDDLFVLESPSSDLSSQSPPHDLVDHTHDTEVHVGEDLMMKHVSIDQHYNDHDVYVREDLMKHVSIDQRYGCNDDDEEEDDDDDDDGGYEYDLDDELVPKSVIDRFGRQRLRKLGKRAYPKMNKSKRLPYYFNRPGCVYGKHGLGMHNIIV